MWVRKGLRCKPRCKRPWLTAGLALPPPLTLSEPNKHLLRLFSAPRDESLFSVCTSQQAANTQDNSNRGGSEEKDLWSQCICCREFTVWA